MFERVHDYMKHVVVQGGAVLFPNVRLGKDVVIFPGAVLGRPPLSTGATFHMPDVSALLPVEIGDECVIGVNAVIYMGVKIGHHSMVGDMAFIREGCTVGNYSLVAGGARLGINVKVGDRVRIIGLHPDRGERER